MSAFDPKRTWSHYAYPTDDLSGRSNMKSYTPGQIAVLVMTLLYIGASALYFLGAGNYEFVWYIGIMLLIVVFVILTISRSNLPTWLLSLLSMWGLSHVLGGGLVVGGEALYEYVIFPFSLNGDFTILRYDQVVHFYGFGLVALIIYYLLDRSTALSSVWISLLAIFTAMGVGALNELIEFMAVLTVSETGVGGYYNTGLDIVANTAGTVCAALIAPYLFKERLNRTSEGRGLT